MANKYKKLVKDTTIFALGKFGSRLILFFLVPLYTHVLSTEEYGTADFIFTMAQLLISILTLTIHDGVIRFGLSKNEKKENVLLCSFIILAGTTILSLLCIPLFGLYSAIGKWNIYLSIMVIVMAFYDVIMNYLKVLNKNILFSIISIFQSASLAVSNIIFLTSLNLGTKGYLLSSILSHLSSVIIAITFGHIVREIKKATFDKKLFKHMVAFSVPLILNNISWWVVQSSDKIMLESTLGTAQLGIYTAAAKIPSLINVFISIFQQSWGLSAIKEVETTNDKKFYSNVFLIYSTAIFIACILLNTIIKPFMSIYVGANFSDSWQYAPLLVASAGFSAISAYFGSMYGALKKSVSNMLTTVSSALINILINLLLINRVGIWGAVIGTVMSYIFISILRMHSIDKRLKIGINYKMFYLNAIIMTVHAILTSAGKYSYIISSSSIIIFVILNRTTIRTIISKLTTKLKGLIERHGR